VVVGTVGGKEKSPGVYKYRPRLGRKEKGSPYLLPVKRGPCIGTLNHKLRKKNERGQLLISNELALSLVWEPRKKKKKGTGPGVKTGSAKTSTVGGNGTVSKKESGRGTRKKQRKSE